MVVISPEKWSGIDLDDQDQRLPFPNRSRHERRPTLNVVIPHVMTTVGILTKKAVEIFVSSLQ